MRVRLQIMKQGHIPEPARRAVNQQIKYNGYNHNKVIGIIEQLLHNTPFKQNEKPYTNATDA